MALEEFTKGHISKEEVGKLAKFAYWQGVFEDNVDDSEYNPDCGSCGSFCSSGACQAGKNPIDYWKKRN